MYYILYIIYYILYIIYYMFYIICYIIYIVYIILSYIILYYIILYSIILYYIVLYCIVFYCIIVYYIVLYSIILYYTTLYYITIYYIILHYITLYIYIYIYIHVHTHIHQYSANVVWLAIKDGDTAVSQLLGWTHLELVHWPLRCLDQGTLVAVTVVFFFANIYRKPRTNPINIGFSHEFCSRFEQLTGDFWLAEDCEKSIWFEAMPLK